MSSAASRVIPFPSRHAATPATPMDMAGLMASSAAGAWLHIAFAYGFFARRMAREGRHDVAHRLLNQMLEQQGFAQNCAPHIRAALLGVRDEIAGDARRAITAAEVDGYFRET